MNVQVLIASMFQEDHSLLEKMNIQTSAIVGNQCDRNEVESFVYNECPIMYYSFSERGVGLNRNNILMRANADICLFADDDMRYYDGYEKKVVELFENNPQADVLLFNIDEIDSKRYRIKKKHKVTYWNFMRYGTVRIAVRLTKIREKGIFFNLCFGGGTEHSHGEDTLFLSECLRKGLKLYAVPESIAELLNDRESTWNNDFSQKYMEDKGILYQTMTMKWWKLLCLQDSIRHQKKYQQKWNKTYKQMTNYGR